MNYGGADRLWLSAFAHLAPIGASENSPAGTAGLGRTRRKVPLGTAEAIRVCLLLTTPGPYQRIACLPCLLRLALNCLRIEKALCEEKLAEEMGHGHEKAHAQ